MIRFRPYASVAVLLVVTLAPRISAVKGKGAAERKGAVINRPPTERPPKSIPRTIRGPSRTAWPTSRRRIMPSHPTNKQAHHPGKPKGPVKVSKPEEKHKDPGRRTGKKDPPKKDPGKNDHGKKDPGKKTGKKPASTPTHNPRGSSQAVRQEGKMSPRIDTPTTSTGIGITISSVTDMRPSTISLTSTTTITGTRSIDTGGTTSSITQTRATAAKTAGRLLRGRRRFRTVGELRSHGSAGKCSGGAAARDQSGCGFADFSRGYHPCRAARRDGCREPLAPRSRRELEDGQSGQRRARPGEQRWRVCGRGVRRLKVAMAEPAPENFFPISQYNWLVNEGTGRGWVALGGASKPNSWRIRAG